MNDIEGASLNKATHPSNQDQFLPNGKPRKKIFKKRNTLFIANPQKKIHGVVIRPAHRAIFENYKEQGFKNMSKAIARTGAYSENVARKTDRITTTQSWKMLMAEYMPPHLLAQRHAELLDKREWKTIKNEDGESVEIDRGPDTAAVTKALDMAYKINGTYSKEEAPQKSAVMYNLFFKDDVRKQMTSFEDGIKQSLLHEINKRHIQEEEAEEANKNNLADGGGDSEDEDRE